VEAVLHALVEQQDELGSLLAGMAPADWDRPSRCAGWTIADVVLHLAQTNEMAIGSAEGHFGEAMEALGAGLPPARDIDEGAGFMVARDRGAGAAAAYQRWRASCTALRAALEAGDPSRRVEWVAGKLSARTLATTRLAETWIHTGDIAYGLGVSVPATLRLWHVARLAWRTLPYAFAKAGEEMTGPVAFELRGPHGEVWHFRDDEVPALTKVRGDADQLCLVAARRLDPADAVHLRARGPDAEAVLRLVRTWA
jgi:uncharacterized protein (TIGR03084 family)